MKQKVCSRDEVMHVGTVYGSNCTVYTCTQIDNREFTVTGAIDSLTARRIDAAEARTRRIIVDSGAGPKSPARVRSPTTPRLRGFQSPGDRYSPALDDDDDYEYYLVETTGERIPLLEAIHAGWVFVEYDNEQDDQLDIQVCMSSNIILYI